MADSTTHPSDRWIPWSIVAFFVFFILLLSGFAMIAFHSYTGEVTQDAYKKGLAYNTDIENADVQKKLGWKTTLETTPQDQNLSITFTLADAAAHSIDNASVAARITRPTQAGHDIEMTLTPAGHGIYRGIARLEWNGVWDLHISATQNGHNYQESKTVIMP